MSTFDEEAAFELIERGIRVALDNPGETVRVEFTRLNAYIEISLGWDGRQDPTFLASLSLSAVDDLRRHVMGQKPRFGTNVHPLCSVILRG